MIQDNILKWYTDEIIRKKYNIDGWPIIEKNIKEDKIKLVFKIAAIKLSLEMDDLTDLNIIFNHFVCNPEVPTRKSRGINYKLEFTYWKEAFENMLGNMKIEDMDLEDIRDLAIDAVNSAFEEQEKVKTNNNLNLFPDGDKKEIEDAEILEHNPTHLLEHKDDIEEAEIVENGDDE